MIFLFEGFELDSERLELRSGGERVRVEPRVLEALVHLVRHRDRVVSKDELAREVWGVAHVTDAALARSIAEARKALGNSSGQKWIETVYGRGYRFIAPVTEQTAEPVPPSIPEEPTPAAVPPRPPSARRWAFPVLVLLLVTSAIAIMGLSLRRTPPSPLPAEAPRLRMAFVPVAAQGEDMELRFAALSISDLLRHRLEDVPGLDLRPQPNGGTDMPAITRRARVDYVLSGSLVPSGTGRGTLTVFLHQLLPTGAVRRVVLGIHEVPYLDRSPDLGRFVAVRDSLIQRLSGELAQRVDFSASRRNEPRSLEGYRLYLKALWELTGSICADGPQLAAARQALALNPEYAPAWHLYAGSQCTLALRCGGGAENYRQALRAIDRAVTLEPGRWGPQEVKAVVLLETGRVEETYELLRRQEERFPNAPRRKLRLAQVLHYAGFLDESRRHLEDVLHAEPALAGLWDLVPYPYLYARDWDRFLELTPREGTASFLYYRAFAELMRGNREEARRLLAPSVSENTRDHFVRLSQALLAIVEDDPARARTLLLDLDRDRQAAGASDGEFNYKIIGELLVLAGDPEAGLPIVERAVRQGFFCVPWIENDPALEGVQGTAEFERIVEAARGRQVEFGRRFGLL